MIRIISYYLCYSGLSFCYCFPWSFWSVQLKSKIKLHPGATHAQIHNLSHNCGFIMQLQLTTSLHLGSQDISSFQDKVTKIHIKILKQFRRYCWKVRTGVKVTIPIKILSSRYSHWFVILLITFAFYFKKTYKF